MQSEADNPSSLHAQYDMRTFRTVECCCLDSFRDELLGRRVVMKIDVEGAEDQALAGARTVLERVRPLIVIECFQAQKMASLSEFGYRVYYLGEGSNWLAIPREYDGEAQKALPGLKNLPSC